MNDKYERQMKKGVLDMLVLKLLEEKPKYGYQLIHELREKSDDIFMLKEGTLYPILYRLEDDCLIQNRWSDPDGKHVPRKYYVITKKGKEALSEITEVWEKMSLGIEHIMKTVL